MNHSKDIPEINLFISCKGITKKNSQGLTNTFVEVSEITNPSLPKKLGVSEVLSDNSDPVFVTSFKIPYFFSDVQRLKITVSLSESLQALSSELLGEVTFTLTEILHSREGLRQVLNIEGLQQGEIFLRYEPVVNENLKKVVLQFKGNYLDGRNGIFRRFKPMFRLYYQTEGGLRQKVYNSEFKCGKHPLWDKFEIGFQKLCRCDMDLPIEFELVDFHHNGKTDFIAYDRFTLNEVLVRGVNNLRLVKPGQESKAGTINSGIVDIMKLEIISVPSFIDYIKGGCEIALHIAIDYTSSNGTQSERSSLHYLNPNGAKNQYETALAAVCPILLEYDSDKSVPLYGFGGVVNKKISHCFHVNFKPDNPNVNGLENIIGAYRNSLKYVGLSGPTLFAPFLKKIISEIQNTNINQNNQVYNIALILTDGVIQDMDETIDLIVLASRLALSIIIVGIGNDSFEKMKILDGDDKVLIDRNGVRMQRDIVQFVAFREVGNSPERLRFEVLEEIPREISNFFEMNNIRPNNLSESEFLERHSSDCAFNNVMRPNVEESKVNPFKPGGYYRNQSVGPCVNIPNKQVGSKVKIPGQNIMSSAERNNNHDRPGKHVSDKKHISQDFININNYPGAENFSNKFNNRPKYSLIPMKPNSRK